MTQNMAFMFLEGVGGGGLMMLIHSTKSPTDAEWEPYFRELSKHDPTKIKSLAITAGGAPSGAQRKLVNDYLNGRQSRAAVVTGNTFVRGVVTALSWFNSMMKAYPPEDFDSALQYLGVRESEIALVRRELAVLQKRVGHETVRITVAA